MLNNLLESKHRRERSVGGSIASVALHGLVMALAVQATLHAGQPADKPNDRIAVFEIPKDETPQPKPEKAAPDVAVAPLPKGFQSLTAPVNISDVLPEIDLGKPVTNPDDFLGKGIPGGVHDGVPGGSAPPDPDAVLTESEVEKPAAVAAGSMSPRYPEMLRVTGAEGSVVAQFVVDTTGRAIGSTLQVLRSTHALFGEAVKNALPMMRFLPAEVGGRKVRQLVQQTFVFAIGGSRALAIGMVGREMRTMHPEMRLVRHS